MTKLLPKLLQRADYLAVENGLLILHPKNGDQATSDKWLKVNRDRVINEILAYTGNRGYLYAGYSTGYYNGPDKSGGITLQFVCPTTRDNAYAIYNAKLKRQRKSALHDAGKRLPKGRFIAPKAGGFVELWRSAGLKIPQRLSGFHDCMGKLKGILFSGETTKSRLIQSTIKPVNISYKEILLATIKHNKTPDKHLTTSRQLPDNGLTIIPDKETATPHAHQDIQPILSACMNECGIKVKGITGIRKSLSTTVQAEEQSITDWLNDYEQENGLAGR